MIEKIAQKIDQKWDEEIQKAIEDFVRIPALSIAFDQNWEKNGWLDQAVDYAQSWAQGLDIPGIKLQKIKLKGASPCLFAEIPGTGKKANDKTVFFYGHLDKQPPSLGWDENKSAWNPVVENGCLYGRGSADDGYAWFCSLSAIKALDAEGIDRPRCVALFETAEESGSQNYEQYLEMIQKKLGDIGLVVVLDSSCGDYDRLWITQSLRGMVSGELKVKVLKHGVHSGEAGGYVPSSFMIIRQLLDRIEDSKTGKILGNSFQVSVPKEVQEETQKNSHILGCYIDQSYPWNASTKRMIDKMDEVILNRAWGSSLSVVGCDGIPDVESAGNVLRPYTTLKLSLRLPPTADAKLAAKSLSDTLTANAPFGAEVSFDKVGFGSGFYAERKSDWLADAIRESSEKLWNNPPVYFGIGASIPLLSMFQKIWPQASFVVAGVLGPKSNAHGPNECLNIAYAKKLTTSVAHIVACMPVDADQ